MKTKVKRMSKRTLAVFLGIMMLVTSIGLGSLIVANSYGGSAYIRTAAGGWNNNKYTATLSNNCATFTMDVTSETKENGMVYFKAYAENDVFCNGEYGNATQGVSFNLSKNSNGGNNAAHFNNCTNVTSITFTINFTKTGTSAELTINSVTTSGGGGGESYPEIYVRGNSTLTGGDFTVLDAWKMSTTDGTNYTLVKNNVSAGSYTYKFANSDWTIQYPNNTTNLDLNVETNGSTVTFTYTLNGTGTATVVPPAAGAFVVDDFDLQYTWINSASCTDEGANKSCDIKKIELIAGHNNSGYDWYVPVVFADATTSGTDKYFFGAATADDGGSKTQKFTVTVSGLATGRYNMKVAVLGFDTQAHAEAAQNQSAASWSLPTGATMSDTQTDTATWFEDANRILTVDDGSSPYASVTARLTVNGISEGKTFSLYNQDSEAVTLKGFTQNGNTAIKTAARTIDAKSALSYSYSYYVYKGSNSNSAVKIGSTQYDTAPDYDTKPCSSNTYNTTLGAISTALGSEISDGDELHFYVLIQAFSDAAHTSANAITNPDNSSAAKGIITARISSTRKGDTVTGSGDLWVDTAPQSTDSTTLVKWSNKQGPAASTSGSQYYFYLPKNSNIDIHRGTYDDTRLTFYYDTSQISNVKISSSENGTYYNISSGSSFHDNGLYIQAGTQYYIKFTPAGGSETTRTVKFIQGSESVAQLYITSPSDMYDSTDGAVTDATTAAAKKSASGQNGTSVTSIKANGSADLTTAAIKKLKGRGNSSWEASARIFGKYAYNLTLSSKANLLGVAGSGNKNKKYCLLANDFDSTQARNVFIFNLAKSLGLNYTPNFQTVDLYNNGTYLGSYLVTQAVDLGNDKLISEKEIKQDEVSGGASANGTYNGKYIQYYAGTGVTSASNYKTGTYLLEFDLMPRAKAEASCFESNQGQYITVSSPEFATQEEVKFVKDAWDEVETAVYDHRLDEVRDKIDVESFVKMYLIQELSKNLDSAASSYNILYKAEEGKFYAQPVWDYDWAVGNYSITKDIKSGPNSSNDPSTTSGYFSRYKKILIQDGTALNKFNFQAMLCDNESFWADVDNVWTNEANAKATAEKTANDSFMDSIQASIEMNDTRWGHIAMNNGGSASNTWGTKSGQGSTYDAVQASLTSWINDRIAYFNHNTTGIAKTGSSTNTYTVGVTTNWASATATATAIGVEGVSSSNAASFTSSNTVSVPEYTYMTFKTTASSSDKEFKGWFTTTDPDTSGGTVNNHNAVSMEEEFSAMVRSDVKIYALYSDKQDDASGGIVSGSIFYYSAPRVTLDVTDGSTSIANASKGDTVYIVATVDSSNEAQRYVDRIKDTSYTAQYVYNFYTVDDDGNKTLIDSQVGAATGDARLTHTLRTTFNDTTKYYVEAYCVNVDPEESPFSVGKASDMKTVTNETVIKTTKIKVYVDLTGKTVTDPSTAKINATDENGIIQEYPLTQLGDSPIYVAEDVVAAYSVKNNRNTSKFTLVSIKVDSNNMDIDAANQPELSSMLNHKTLWYKATGSFANNYSQSFYTVRGNVDTHVNTDEFVSSVYRTQGSELQTKRIYLTNNLADNFSAQTSVWEHFNVVYTVDKSVTMHEHNTTAWYNNYSNDHTNVVWFTKRMEEAGYGNVDSQGLMYVDLPYNVTAYYFENGEYGADQKLEVMYSNGTSNLGNDYAYCGANHDDQAWYDAHENEINAYYIAAYKTTLDSADTTAGRVNGYVRMWNKHDWPSTAYLSKYKQDVYITKGKTLDITPTAENASVGVFYESNNTSVASVSAGGTLSAVDKGTAKIKITPVGYANGSTTQAPGIIQTVKVTVIDKDYLFNMVSEAEEIITAHNKGTGANYTEASYDAFDDVYSMAIEIYNKSLYSQTEVDFYAELLHDAMANLHTETKGSSYPFSLIAYNSSHVVVRSDTHGNINAPTINDDYTNDIRNLAGAAVHVDINKSTITPYVKTVTANQEYELLYAEGIAFKSTASASDPDFAFTNWTMDDVQVTTNAELAVSQADPGDSEYIAHFNAPDYTVTLNYKFKDFDTNKAHSYEYKPDCEKDSWSNYSVDTTLTSEEAKVTPVDSSSPTTETIKGSKLYDMAVNFTPDVVSSYYNYRFPTDANLTDTTKYSVTKNDETHTITATITLSNSMKTYSLYLNGTRIGNSYHYQQEVTLNAQTNANLASYDKYIWFITDERNSARAYVEGTDSPLALKTDGDPEFRLRVLEDNMYVNVYSGVGVDSVNGTSIASSAYSEVKYVNNNKRLQQNFYIQDNLTNKGDLIGAGNFCYYWNTATNRPAVTTVYNNYNSGPTNEQLTALVTSNYSTWAGNVDGTTGKYAGKINGLNFTYYKKPAGQADTDGILRYSTINNFYSYYYAVSTAVNPEKYANWTYRVHSFMVYNDNGTPRVAVSTTYAEADVHWDT